MVLRTYLVYNTVVRLCQFFHCGGKVNFVRMPYSHDRFSKISRTFFVKKIGCAIVITTGKKSSSRLSGRCAIVITTGKKNSSRLSGGCAIIIMTGKKRCTSSTSIKTNTYPLHLWSIHTISCKIGHMIQIVPD